MPKTLEISLLGQIHIRYDETPVADLTGKTLALLSYLVVTAGPHPRSLLAGLLWGGMPEANARANLSKSLSTLRREFAPHLIITRQTVGFDRASDYWLDVQAFESLLQDLGPEQDQDVEALQQAVQLYHGDFLEQSYVRDALEFEQWVLTQRVRLRELALQALYALAAHFAGQGTAGRETAIVYTTHLLRLEPWREEAHREMMLLLAQNGQRGAALAQYETCRRVLAEELGVEPGPEILNLYERIRDGVLRASVSVPGAAVAHKDAESLTDTRHNLPPQPTPFVGREPELADLEQLITDPDIRLITIVGPGGIGKTRVALATAERQLDQAGSASDSTPTIAPASRFPDGVCFVPLAALSAPEDILPALADALDFQMQGGAGDTHTAKQQVLDHLRRKQLLLVLDNLEHLLESAADLVADILRTAPTVQILATSRERLNLHEEQVYPIQGLEFPDWVAPEDAAHYTAAQLFLQSARRVRPGFVLETADVATLTGICQMVGGMPLALELAAAWVDALPLDRIAAQISGGLDFLETEWRDVPRRHRSMRAVIDGSWHQLSPDEREVFAQLSVFRGGFTRQAARAIVWRGDAVPVSLRTLARLVSKSLVQYDESRDRYDVHELLRQYAAEKLVHQKSDFFAAYDRHSAYYCAALERWEADLHGPRRATVRDQIEADLANARAAYNRAAAEQDVGRLDQALQGMLGFYWQRDRYFEMIAAGQTAIDALNQVDVTATEYADALRLKVVTLTELVQVHLGIGQDTQAKALLQQGAELLHAPALVGHDIRREQALLLLRMAQASPDIHEDAQQFLEESRSIFQSLGDREMEAWCLANLGDICRLGGDIDGARQFYEESLAIHRALSNYAGIGSVLFYMCQVACQTGDFDAAKRMHSDILVVARTAGLRDSDTAHLVLLARVHRFCGDVDGARVRYAESQAMNSLLAFTPLATMALLGLGELAMDVYESKEAKLRFENALVLSQEHNSQAYIGHALASLGHLALYQGEFKAAADFLRQSAALTRATAFRLAVAFELAEMGAALWSLGDFAAADKAIEEALAIPEGTAVREELAVLTLYRAQLQTYIGRYDHARESAQATLALALKTKPESIIGPRVWCPAYIPKSYSGKGAVGRAHGVLGWAALGEERYAEAEQALIESAAAFRTIGARDQEAWALAGLGRAAYGLSNRVKADQHLRDALKIVVEIRAFIPLLHLIPIIPVLFSDGQNPNLKVRAVELYALAQDHPFVANSRLLHDIAGQHVRAETADLPSKVVEAAQARGRALDWWDTAVVLQKELLVLDWRE